MYRWNGEKLDDKIKNQMNAYLHSVGNIMQNELVSNSPVLTGALRDSIEYVVSGESGNISSPVKPNSVTAGSALVYAASVEKRGKSAGWMSRTWDILVASRIFEALAGRIFKV
jgi:hypothetical protein